MFVIGNDLKFFDLELMVWIQSITIMVLQSGDGFPVLIIQGAVRSPDFYCGTQLNLDLTSLHPRVPSQILERHHPFKC